MLLGIFLFNYYFWEIPSGLSKSIIMLSSFFPQYSPVNETHESTLVFIAQNAKFNVNEYNKKSKIMELDRKLNAPLLSLLTF